MKHAMTLGSLVCCFLCTGLASARAEPFTVTSTITTDGWFSCTAIQCGGQGTNSITLGSGLETATLTFTGLSSTFEVTNKARPVALGAFELIASDGFVFPAYPAPHPRFPIVRFSMTLGQAQPVLASTTIQWLFGPGGRPSLSLQKGGSYSKLPIGPDSPYRAIVYSFEPFPIILHPGRISLLSARVGAVPEPSTLLLVGSGLAGAVVARRRRRVRAM
jgi:hypothetical protein